MLDTKLMNVDLEKLKLSSISKMIERTICKEKPPCTIADLQNIFDDYKNDVFIIYTIDYKIVFVKDVVAYNNFLNYWDDFKRVMNEIIDNNPQMKLE